MAVRIYTNNGKPAISKHNRPTNSKLCTKKMYSLYLRARIGLDECTEQYNNSIRFIYFESRLQRLPVIVFIQDWVLNLNSMSEALARV